MTDRQFLWGLSNGIIVLAIAGVFWLGWGFGPHLGNGGWLLPAAFTLVVYGTCGAIIWQAVRLRRRVGFKRAEFKQGDEHQRAESHKIMVRFRRIAIAQAVLVALGVLLCLSQGLEDLVAPWIALIVSLHFIPLGWIFHVQVYKIVGLMGCALSLVAFSPAFGADRLMFLGGTMGLILWLSAVYLAWRADRIGAKAVSEPWSV
jgi:hypothetical protein